MEDRHALLQKINEISFVFNDLTLYLVAIREVGRTVGAGVVAKVLG